MYVHIFTIIDIKLFMILLDDFNALVGTGPAYTRKLQIERIHVTRIQQFETAESTM